jgi:hypothetical protein
MELNRGRGYRKMYYVCPPEPLDFRSSDWGSIDNAYRRFLKEAWGSRGSAERNLNQNLENGRLRVAFLRLESQVRQQNLLVQLPEQRAILPDSFWRIQYTTCMHPTGQMWVCLRPGQKAIPGDLRLFVWLPDLDVIFRPAGSAEAETAAIRPATTKVARAKRDIQNVYGRLPHEIPKEDVGTGTVVKRVNAELKLLGLDRYTWDTINRALGRDPR